MGWMRAIKFKMNPDKLGLGTRCLVCSRLPKTSPEDPQSVTVIGSPLGFNSHECLLPVMIGSDLR